MAVGAGRHFAKLVNMKLRWNRKHYGMTPKFDLGAITSPGTISFHDANPLSKMRRNERLLYGANQEEQDCSK